MRVKISLNNPETSQKENHLISIPSNLKYISDLEVHIIEILNLSNYLIENQFSISLNIGGFMLPKKEKLSELINEKDLIK